MPPVLVRTLLLAAACLVAGILLGVWISDRPSPGSTNALSRSDSEAGEAEPVPARLVGREASSPLEGGRPRSERPVEGAVPLPDANDTSCDSREVAWLEVEVRKPPGAIVHGGTIYALPAGRPGVDHVSLVPHAEIQDNSDADAFRIPLPRAGWWDVGYTGPLGHELVPDVRVTAGQVVPVTLELPPQGSITFFFVDSDAAAWASGRHVAVSVRPAGDAEEVAFPGRGESGGHRYRASFNDRSRAVLPAVPAGRVYDLALHYEKTPARDALRGISLRQPSPAWCLTLQKDRVSAGEEVAISLVRSARLELVFVLEGEAAPAWPDSSMSGVGVRVERRGGLHAQAHLRVERGTRVSPSRWTLILDPGNVSVAWGGSCCRPGRLDGVGVRAAETTKAEVKITILPGHVPGARDAPSLRVRVEGAAPSGWGPMTYAADPVPRADAVAGEVVTPYVKWGEVRSGLTYELDGAQWGRGRTVAAVQAPDRASRPVLVASAAGEVTLKLEEGGFLLPLPTWWSAEELGALRLIRSDLRPMPVSRWYQASPCPDLLYPVATITVEAGLLIGPLPPGTYAFDVLLGTTPIGKITGTVRARRIEVMRLPR